MTSWLWWLSITFYGIGDILTTATTQLSSPIAEGSPVVESAAAAYGIWGLVGLKIVAFAVAYGVWYSVDSPHNVGVPLALSVLGVGLTTWNLVVISAVFSG
jgi:hypothetical protein